MQVLRSFHTIIQLCFGKVTQNCANLQKKLHRTAAVKMQILCSSMSVRTQNYQKLRPPDIITFGKFAPYAER